MKENYSAISLDCERKVQDATSSIMHGATHASHVGKVFQLCSGSGSPQNIHQKYDLRCRWRTCLGPFLAKTSRTAVLTAIMDLSAGGRLYKCLYKMHVASRAFWGAFWGAFRVFLRDVG